jgi:hypothetical protein
VIVDDTMEPATGSLLDEGNVGKWVWLVHNGNDKHRYKVLVLGKGRTNVYVEDYGGRQRSLRVNDTNPNQAFGSVGDYPVAVFTEEAWADRGEREELIRRLGRLRGYSDVSTAALRQAVELLNA